MYTVSDVKELREKTGAGMMDCKKALEACEGNMDKAVDWLREKGIAKAAKKESRIAAEGLCKIKVDGNTAVMVEVNSETDFVAKNAEFTGFVDYLLDEILKNNVKTNEDVLAIKDGEETVSDKLVALTAKIGEKLSFRRFTRIEKKDSEVFGEYIHMGGKIAVLTVIDNASSEVAREVAMHAAAMRPLYTKSSEVPTDVLEKEKAIMREQLINEGKPAERIDGILVGKVKKYYEEVCLENQIFVKAQNKETVSEYVANNGGTITTMIRYEVGEGMEKREENFAEEVAKQMNM